LPEFANLPFFKLLVYTQTCNDAEQQSTGPWVSKRVPRATTITTTTHLVRDPAVGARVPGHQVRLQPLDPATLLGAQVLLGQAHVPVGAGAQHGQEGHQVAHAVHRELRGGGRTPGGGGVRGEPGYWYRLRLCLHLGH